LLSNKAPNIPITTSINISKRGLGALKKRRRKKKKKKERGQMSQHKGGFEQPKFFPNSSKFKRGINFFKEQK
jgi:hypothetical protein